MAWDNIANFAGLVPRTGIYPVPDEASDELVYVDASAITPLPSPGELASHPLSAPFASLGADGKPGEGGGGGPVRPTTGVLY